MDDAGSTGGGCSCAGSQKRRRRVLWLPHTSWSHKQRARYLAQWLNAEYELHVVTWESIAAWRDLLDAHKVQRALTSNDTFLEMDRIWLHRRPQLPGSRFGHRLRDLNERLLQRALLGLAKKVHAELIIASLPIRLPDVGIPVLCDVVDDHTSYWRDVRNKPELGAELAARENDMLRCCSSCVVVSDALREKLGTFGLQAEVIPNGFDPAMVTHGDRVRFRRQLGVAESDRVIGYIGWFGEFSGLLTATRSVRLWPERTMLVVAGDGPMLPEAKRTAAEMGIRNVRFVGWLPDPRDFFAGIDVGLLPFDVYDFTSMASPMKLFEYLGAGKKVVSTDLSGVASLGLPGVTVTDATPDALAEGVRMALSATADEPNSAHLARFEWSALAARMQNAIERTLEQSGNPS